jgi:hypothetical protein
VRDYPAEHVIFFHFFLKNARFLTVKTLSHRAAVYSWIVMLFGNCIVGVLFDRLVDLELEKETE